MLIPTDKKRCPACCLYKTRTFFHKNKRKVDGLDLYCKPCKSIRCKKYYSEHKEKYFEKNKKYRENHREELLIKKREWSRKNRDSINERVSKRHNKLYKSDPEYKFKFLIRSRMRNAIKNGYKNGSAIKDLGCTSKFAVNYIAEKFKPGMSWENHGEWHIDHIKPLANFNLQNREQYLQAVHYTNLQPLWAKDNLKKKDHV
jgi:hypothetical protein